MAKNNPPQTIMLVVWDGFGARLLLRTGLFSALKEAGHRLVILSPNAHETYFLKEFEDEQVRVERLEMSQCISRFRSSKLHRALAALRTYTLNQLADLSSVDVLMSLQLNDANSSRLKRVLFRAIVPSFRRFRVLRKLLLAVEIRLARGNFHTDLFRKYRPELVVATTMGSNPTDAYVLREARQFGAKTAVVIQNWDQPGKRGYRGVTLDAVVAWGETMREEILTGHDLPEKTVVAAGVPHFDIHSSNGNAFQFDEFCERFGLDPRRKILLFGTKAPQNYPYNADIVDILAEAIMQEKLTQPCQVLVRLHPKHFAGREGPLDTHTYGALFQRYEEIHQKCPYVVSHSPQVLSTALDLDLPSSDMIDLAAMIRNSSVVITPFSSLNLESFICDVPVVNVAFDGYRKDRLGYEGHGSSADYINYSWIRRTLESNSCRLAQSGQELIDQINSYLEHPELDREGRRQTVQRECGPQDGRAGNRAGEILLNLLNNR